MLGSRASSSLCGKLRQAACRRMPAGQQLTVWEATAGCLYDSASGAQARLRHPAKATSILAHVHTQNSAHQLSQLKAQAAATRGRGTPPRGCASLKPSSTADREAASASQNTHLHWGRGRQRAGTASTCLCSQRSGHPPMSCHWNTVERLAATHQRLCSGQRQKIPQLLPTRTKWCRQRTPRCHAPAPAMPSGWSKELVWKLAGCKLPTSSSAPAHQPNCLQVAADAECAQRHRCHAAPDRVAIGRVRHSCRGKAWHSVESF